MRLKHIHTHEGSHIILYDTEEHISEMENRVVKITQAE